MMRARCRFRPSSLTTPHLMMVHTLMPFNETLLLLSNNRRNERFHPPVLLQPLLFHQQKLLFSILETIAGWNLLGRRTALTELSRNPVRRLIEIIQRSGFATRVVFRVRWGWFWWGCKMAGEALVIFLTRFRHRHIFALRVWFWGVLRGVFITSQISTNNPVL